MKKNATWWVLVGGGALGALMVSAPGCGGDDANGGAVTSDAGGAPDGTMARDAHPPPPPVDASSDTPAPQMDGSTPPVDAGADARADAGVDAGPPSPNGDQLVTADAATLFGVTSDGYAVYTTGKNSTVWVIDASAADAGAPVKIADITGPNFGIVVYGKVLFFWNGVQAAPAPQVGALTVWSKATGVHAIAGTTYDSFAAASADGSKIVYATANAAGTVGDVTGATADGTSPVVLASQADLPGQGACSPQVAFASTNDAVVAYCPASDAAAPTATLDAFSGAGWTRKNLATGLKPSNPNVYGEVTYGPTMGSVFTVDATFTNILALSSSGDAIAIQYPAGTASTLESGADTPAFIAASGGTPTAVYVTQSGAVHGAPIPPASPATLVASGAKAILDVASPDAKWGVYATATNSTPGGPVFDLHLFSTTLPATTKVVEAATDAFFGGQPPYPLFTADSSHLIWDNGLTAVAGGSAATLNSYDLASATSTKVADKVWIHYSLGAPTPTRVVYDDNSRAVSLNGWTDVIADIQLVDVAVSPLAPKMLQAGADANFFVTSDSKNVVYSYNVSANVAQNGIYVAPAQ